MKVFRFYFTMISVISVNLYAASVTDDWPQLQGPNHRGISEKKGLARRWPKGGPPVLWSRPVGPGFGGPSIRDGQVYLLDRINDEKDVLWCLELMTGEQRWQYVHEAPGRLTYNGSRSVPTVGPARVFAVGPFGNLYCVDRNTHKLLWHLDIFKEFAKEPPPFGYVQSPLIYKDSVIICPASESVGMVALDQMTGEVRWRSKPLGTKGYVSPIVHRLSGVDAVLFLTDKQVCGVDPATGDVLWHYGGYHPPQPIPFPAVIDDGRLFITAADDAGSVMIKVSLQGEYFKVCELFRLDHYGSQLHPPIYYEGFLYGKFFTHERNTLVSRLICFDLQGNIKWKMGNKPRIERGNLIIADKMIFTLDGETGELSMVKAKPEGYQELGRAKVLEGKNNFVISPMALSNGRLIVRDQHNLKCLDVRMMRDES